MYGKGSIIDVQSGETPMLSYPNRASQNTIQSIAGITRQGIVPSYYDSAPKIDTTTSVVPLFKTAPTKKIVMNPPKNKMLDLTIEP
jgi:hypothetical protein